ncbi:CoxE Protein containing von Willebrand factor type A (vWA) domain [Rhabdaerophilaceae bacterium]
MAAERAEELEIGGHLAENVVYFARTLRAAGMKLGPGAALDAVAALEAIGLGHRDEFRAALESVFVKRRQDAELFDQAFRLFWRRRALLEKLMATIMPMAPSSPDDKRKNTLRRLTDAMMSQRPQQDLPPKQELELDSKLTVSDVELLRHRDFEGMTALELAEAKREISKLRLPMQYVRTRRFLVHPSGTKPDMRASLRAALRGGGASLPLLWRKPREIMPPLVAICDISGSMSQYSRIFLHFLHALGESGRTVHAFTFATELTNISRALRSTRDPDQALAGATALVRDWDGGTRIGVALGRFNRMWSRRVMAGGPIVLLITDGLEREGSEDLAREVSRLHRTARRLIWLNPLLRFDGFEAKALGIRTMLPHVDELRTLHNLSAMRDLCEALAETGSADADPRRYLKRNAA